MKKLFSSPQIIILLLVTAAIIISSIFLISREVVKKNQTAELDISNSKNGTIFRAGTYILQNDLIADQAKGEDFVIEIEIDDVTIDLNGKTLRCVNIPMTEFSYGILGNKRKNVVIKNGRIEGCVVGVQLSHSEQVHVDNVTFQNIAYMGIILGGKDNSVNNSTFSNFGGWSGEGYTIGINNPGHNCKIQGNRFHELYRQKNVSPSKVGEGVGIIVSANTKGCHITSNFMNNTQLRQPASIAVWAAEKTEAFISENHIINFARGIKITDGSVTHNVFELKKEQLAKGLYPDNSSRCSKSALPCAIIDTGKAEIHSNRFVNYEPGNEIYKN